MAKMFYNSSALEYIAEKIAIEIVLDETKQNEILGAISIENNSKWSKFLKCC